MLVPQLTSFLIESSRMTIENRYYRDIIEGPSREDLRDSLGSKVNRRLDVTFRVKGKWFGHGETTPDEDYTCIINGLKWADHTGTLFEVEGYVIGVNNKDHKPYKLFEGTYSTVSRKGTLTIPF